MRYVLVIAACLALCACALDQRTQVGGLTFGGPALISGHSPPNAVSANSEPEPPNSLPPGAEGLGASGPNGRFPNAAALTFPSPI